MPACGRAPRWPVRARSAVAVHTEAQSQTVIVPDVSSHLRLRVSARKGHIVTVGRDNVTIAESDREGKPGRVAQAHDASVAPIRPVARRRRARALALAFTVIPRAS